MSPILFGLVLFILALVLLALFARGGAVEPAPVPARPPEDLRSMSPEEIARQVAQVFGRRGYRVVSQAVKDGYGDLLLEDRTPLTGQRIYVRTVRAPPEGAVESAEVQAAIDRVRGDQLGKAVVVTPGTFSDSARLLSTGVNVELIDGPALASLLREGVPAGRPATVTDTG